MATNKNFKSGIGSRFYSFFFLRCLINGKRMLQMRCFNIWIETTEVTKWNEDYMSTSLIDTISNTVVPAS